MSRAPVPRCLGAARTTKGRDGLSLPFVAFVGSGSQRYSHYLSGARPDGLEHVLDETSSALCIPASLHVSPLSSCIAVLQSLASPEGPLTQLTDNTEKEHERQTSYDEKQGVEPCPADVPQPTTTLSVQTNTQRVKTELRRAAGKDALGRCVFTVGADRRPPSPVRALYTNEYPSSTAVAPGLRPWRPPRSNRSSTDGLSPLLQAAPDRVPHRRPSAGTRPARGDQPRRARPKITARQPPATRAHSE